MAAASWGSTTDGCRLGHGFLRKGEIPKRKRAFWTEEKSCSLLPGWLQTLVFGWDLFVREDREQCEKVRKGHLSCSWTLKGFTSSHSSTIPSRGRFFHLWRNHKPFSEKEIPARNLTDQNFLRDTQLTEPFCCNKYPWSRICEFNSFRRQFPSHSCQLSEIPSKLAGIHQF